MIRTLPIVFVLVLGALVITASSSAFAQPAAAQPAAAAPAPVAPAPVGSIADPAALPPPPPTVAAPADLKAQCMTAINGDPAWTDELIGKLAALDSGQWTKERIESVQRQVTKKLIDDLTADSQDRHEKDAKLMATNHRHVILAYGAIWLATIGFVVFVWQRNQKLRGELDRLSRDLARATAESAKP